MFQWFNLIAFIFLYLLEMHKNLLNTWWEGDKLEANHCRYHKGGVEKERILCKINKVSYEFFNFFGL
ncbi:hypothetical protein VNO77_18616 [Canavalia gladiata]|uniref:Uncharacterized protein n=1 Tax=Canavalia gladiata TaxID=3824 RepID=A0AAN9LL25_CANGL